MCDNFPATCDIFPCNIGCFRLSMSVPIRPDRSAPMSCLPPPYGPFLPPAKHLIGPCGRHVKSRLCFQYMCRAGRGSRTMIRSKSALTLEKPPSQTDRPDSIPTESIPVIYELFSKTLQTNTAEYPEPSHPHKHLVHTFFRIGIL